MFTRISDWAEQISNDYEGAIHLRAREGTRSIRFPAREELPQVISISFVDEAIPERLANNLEIKLLRMTNDTGWEVVDEDGVYDGNVGVISVARDVPLEELDGQAGERRLVDEADFE